MLSFDICFPYVDKVRRLSRFTRFQNILIICNKSNRAISIYLLFRIRVWISCIKTLRLTFETSDSTRRNYNRFFLIFIVIYTLSKIIWFIPLGACRNWFINLRDFIIWLFSITTIFWLRWVFDLKVFRYCRMYWLIKCKTVEKLKFSCFRHATICNLCCL